MPAKVKENVLEEIKTEIDFNQSSNVLLTGMLPLCFLFLSFGLLLRYEFTSPVDPIQIYTHTMLSTLVS